MSAPVHEQDTERGSELLMRGMLAFAQTAGRRLTRWLMFFPVTYFFFSAPNERRISRSFLERSGYVKRAHWWQVWRHFYWFGAASLDRVYLLRGRFEQFDIANDGSDALDEANLAGGLILVLAHCGSFEALRAQGALQRGQQISMVMDRALGQRFMSMMRRVNPELHLDIIDSQLASVDLIFAVRRAIEAGRIVGMMGDRLMPGERSATVELFGAPVRMPVSAYAVGAVLGVPVFAGFGIYQGGNRYRVAFQRLQGAGKVKRSEREATLQRSAQDFATELERRVARYPYNWFNFYDFWSAQGPTDVGPTDV